MTTFRGRVAVITGAASGIGLAMANRFAAEGMRIAMADLDATGLEREVARLRASGAEVSAHTTDVSKPRDVEALAAHVFARFGAVHVLCNNAGLACAGAPVWEQPLESWERLLSVNFGGVVNGIRGFIPRMIAGGEEGHVVNTASAAGLRTGPLIGPYYASKHAVVALSESLYFDLALADARIQVSVLCPGFARTNIAANSPGFPDPMRARVEAGMEPAAIAQAAFEAIRDRRFWVLTHPDFDPLIRERCEGMLRRENPVAHVFR